jgi:hypothetical protein
MIRPTTALCMIAAFGSGLYLYSEKHQTSMLDREIGRVFRATQAAHERTGLLRAEWALLNEPGRLQDMADKYLALHTMAPSQFVQLADLQNHLPPPAAAQPQGTTDEYDALAPADPAVAPANTPAVVSTDKAPDAAGPPPAPRSGTPPAAKPAAPKLLAKAEPKPHAQKHLALASNQAIRDAIRPIGTPLPLAAPQPVTASTMSVLLVRPMRGASRSSVVSAVPSYPTAAPYVGSALGGRPSLPPPVPYAGE